MPSGSHLGGILSPRGHLTMFAGTFGCHNWQALLASSSRRQRAAKHPAAHKHTSTLKNYLGQPGWCGSVD